jgi:DNA-binding NtrC family response regulator
MTSVLVVHHDVDMADQEADWLRRSGYAVVQCSGPTHGPCPILQGLPCPAVEDVDVLVYDVWASGSGEVARELIEGLRELHPNVPMVLTAPGMEFDWVEDSGVHGVVPLVGALSAERLDEAVQKALASVAAA